MDSLTVPPTPYTEKTGFHRVHRMLVSIGPERPVSESSEDAGVGLRPDAGSLVIEHWLATSGPTDVAAHRGDSV